MVRLVIMKYYSEKLYPVWEVYKKQCYRKEELYVEKK